MSAPPRPNTGRGYRAVMAMAAFVLIVAGLSAARSLLLPILVAIFASVLTAPVVLQLERRGVPGTLAVLGTMLAAMSLFGGVAVLVTLSVQDFSSALPGYSTRLNALLADAEALAARVGLRISEEQLARLWDPGQLVQVAGAGLNALATAMTDTFMVVFMMTFMLFEAAGSARKLRAAVGRPDADLARFAGLVAKVQRYLAIKTFISLGTGLLAWAWLSFLGVDSPVLWGLIAFLLNYIPTVGSIIAGVPPVLVALLQHGVGTALLVVAGYVLLNVGTGNAIEPQLMGRRLGLSPLVIFLSLVFWGWLWGVLGALLAVPMTMVVKIFFEQSEEFRFIATLMEPAPPPESTEAPRAVT